MVPTWDSVRRWYRRYEALDSALEIPRRFKWLLVAGGVLISTLAAELTSGYPGAWIAVFCVVLFSIFGLYVLFLHSRFEPTDALTVPLIRANTTTADATTTTKEAGSIRELGEEILKFYQRRRGEKPPAFFGDDILAPVVGRKTYDEETSDIFKEAFGERCTQAVKVLDQQGIDASDIDYKYGDRVGHFSPAMIYAIGFRLGDLSQKLGND